MRKHSAVFLICAMSVVQWGLAQVQPGTTCQSAIAIECGVSYETNTAGVANDNATSGAAVCGSVGSGGQIWYSFTAAETGMLNINTCGSSMDTYIHVYTG